MKKFYIKISLVSFLVYSIIITLNAVRDFLYKFESGELYAVSFFSALAVVSIGTLWMVNQKSSSENLNSQPVISSYLIVDFLSGFIRGFQKS